MSHLTGGSGRTRNGEMGNGKWENANVGFFFITLNVHLPNIMCTCCSASGNLLMFGSLFVYTHKQRYYLHLGHGYISYTLSCRPQSNLYLQIHPVN